MNHQQFTTMTNMPSDEEINRWHDECADLTRLGTESHFWAFDVSSDDVREIARAVLSKWGVVTPQPQPPAEGEVAELVAWLRANALTVQKASGNPANGAKQRMNRAADLLSRLAPQPQPPAEGEVAELVAWLRETGQQGLDSGLLFAEQNGRRLTRAADLLDRLAPQPVTEGPTDAELLRCAISATPCYDTKAWDRELQMMRAAIALDRARWGRA